MGPRGGFLGETDGQGNAPALVVSGSRGHLGSLAHESWVTVRGRGAW